MAGSEKKEQENILSEDKSKTLKNEQKEKKVTLIYANSPWILIKNLPKESYYIILTHSHDYDFKIINEILNFNSFKFFIFYFILYY